MLYQNPVKERIIQDSQYNSNFRNSLKVGVHTCNPSTRELEAERTRTSRPLRPYLKKAKGIRTTETFVHEVTQDQKSLT